MAYSPNACFRLRICIGTCLLINDVRSNSDTFLRAVTTSINEDGAEAAKEICSKTDGPVAAIFHAGLSKLDRGHDETEKAIQNANWDRNGISRKNMIG